MPDRQVLLPSESHPITVTPTTERVRVYAGDTLVADTTRALTLAEASYADAQYVPVADVDASLVTTSSTRTWCPYKGEASYYSVTTPEGTVEDAGWYYSPAHDAVGEISDHVAWYPDRVRVVVG